MTFNFLAKKILVTGAGRGLGRALAIKLAENGADVFAVSRTAATLDTLKKLHPSITTISLDLSDWKETRSVLNQLEPMDGLVNNAGKIPDKVYEAMETDEDSLNIFMKANLYNPINCTQSVAAKMISAGKQGSIVNVSSHASLWAYRNIIPYSVSKAGLDMATKQFALELGAHNIRVNSVNPSLFLSDTIKESIAEARTDSIDVDGVVSRIPMKRLPEIDEIVGPVLYLLSDHSSMVTGTIHVIDGGMISSFSP